MRVSGPRGKKNLRHERLKMGGYSKVQFRQDDDSSQQDPQKMCTRLRPSETVGQDGYRISLARLSIHGAGHQTQEKKTLEARRSRRQSVGQDRQTARHRLQSGQEFARQVESRRQEYQGHR